MSRIKLIVNNLYTKDLYVSYSLLILRVIASVMMIVNHGWNKILAGQEKWNRLGTALTDFIGIEFMSVFCGFMAAFSESIGMVMVIFGIFTRPAAFLLLFTMFVASMNHLVDGEFPELAIMYLIVMLALLISGPGKFSLDYKFFSQKN